MYPAALRSKPCLLSRYRRTRRRTQRGANKTLPSANPKAKGRPQSCCYDRTASQRSVGGSVADRNSRASGCGGGAPAAATERLCYRAAAGYMRLFTRVCIYVVSDGPPTRRLPSTSPSLAGWPGTGGAGGTGAAAMIICFGRCSGEVLAGRAAAAAAGSGRECWRSLQCSTPSPSRVLRCRLCLTIAKQKTGMDRSGPAPPLSAGPAGSAGAA